MGRMYNWGVAAWLVCADNNGDISPSMATTTMMTVMTMVAMVTTVMTVMATVMTVMTAVVTAVVTAMMTATLLLAFRSISHVRWQISTYHPATHSTTRCKVSTFRIIRLVIAISGIFWFLVRVGSK